MLTSPYPLLQVNIFTFPGKATEEAEAVRQAFIDTLKQRAFDELGPLDVQLVGWRGIEGRDVMVEVIMLMNTAKAEVPATTYMGRLTMLVKKGT